MCSIYIVTGAKTGTSHHLLYDEVQWQTLNRRKTIKLNLVHKIVYNTAPTYLCEMLPNYVGDDVTYNLSGNQNLCQIKCTTEKFRKSFLPNCINLWTNLDEGTKSMQDFEDFKASTKFNKVANELIL